MRSLTRRTFYYFLVLIAATGLFTGLYSLGMSMWEAQPRPWYRALEVVIQTFTTTGYGEDAPWQSLQMNVLVIVMQLAGIGFILSAVDMFAVPWLREALRPAAPKTIAARSDHVIVCGYTPRVEVFIDEMQARGRDYVLLESNPERAGTLHEQEYRVIEGQPTSTAALERAHLASARALVADLGDEKNASIALAAREVDPEARVITLVDDASLARYHRAAGADVVLSPRRLLGRSLAAKVPMAAAANVEESLMDGDALDFGELIITPHNPLYGQLLGEARIPRRFEVRVIGAWIDGIFETPVDSALELGDGTRLFVAGTPDRMEVLRKEMAPYVRAFTPQSILLAGYGDSGQAAYHSLRRLRADVTVLDVENREGVDVVGDVRDPDRLRAAGIDEASTLIVAVDDDTVATFAILIARDLNPDLQILVRARDEQEVQNLYRAGADFVQALPTVCGRMLAATAFEDEAHLPRDRSVSVVRLSAGGLEGQLLDDVDPEAQTNYTILAVIRNGEFLTGREDEAFAFEAGDDVIVAGTEDGIQQFQRRLEE